MKKCDSSIILIQGYPGSGKSTVAKKLAESYLPDGFLSVSHFSIGEHLRKISNGEVDSDFKKALKLESKALVNSRRINDDLVNRIVDEYVSKVGKSELILVDGYPLYEAQVPMFDESIRKRGLLILGLLDVQISPERAAERILGRGTRKSEIAASREFAWQRVVEHRRDSLDTTVLLTNIYTAIAVNGDQLPEQVLDASKQAISQLV